MKVIVQRSLSSSVSVENKVVGEIKKGMVLLVGFQLDDTINDIDYMVQKIIHLRIFDDDNGIMNQSILESGGEVLSISQFTLYADTSRGNRPSYSKAMKFEQANQLYKEFNHKLGNYLSVKEGVFGADMKVSITNDGPITIILESRDHSDKK